MATAAEALEELIESLKAASRLRFTPDEERRLQDLRDRDTNGGLTPGEQVALGYWEWLSEFMSETRADAERVLDRLTPCGGNSITPARRSGFPSFLRSRWAAPVFLIPFVLMLAVHWWLGLSDALLVADDPGARPAHGYNLLLGINMNLCVAAAIHHLVTRSQREAPWIIAKLLIPAGLFLLGFSLL